MKETGKGKRLEDRLLGDEWSDWKPGAKAAGSSDSPKSLFLVFSFLVLLFVLIGVWLFWYLALPRLESFGPGFVRLAGAAVTFFACLLALWYASQALSSLLKLKLVPCAVANRYSLRFLLGAAVKASCFFGIARDRISNSFVKLHNDLMYATGSGRNSQRLLVLLPRCLSAEIRGRIKELGEKYRFVAYTAFGGDEARQAIKANRPDAVIAVACERDLISGIQDTSPSMPVFGLPNTRPEGPCKNTSINMDELEKIVKYCISK